MTPVAKKRKMISLHGYGKLEFDGSLESTKDEKTGSLEDQLVTTTRNWPGALSQSRLCLSWCFSSFDV